jgi:hypothetical protein
MGKCFRPGVQYAAEPDHVYHFVSQNVNQKRVQVPEQVFPLGGGEYAPIVEFDAVEIEGLAGVDALQEPDSCKAGIGQRFPSMVHLGEQIVAELFPSKRGNAVIARSTVFRFIKSLEYQVSLRG